MPVQKLAEVKADLFCCKDERCQFMIKVLDGTISRKYRLVREQKLEVGPDLHPPSPTELPKLKLVRWLMKNISEVVDEFFEVDGRRSALAWGLADKFEYMNQNPDSVPRNMHDALCDWQMLEKCSWESFTISEANEVKAFERGCRNKKNEDEERRFKGLAVRMAMRDELGKKKWELVLKEIDAETAEEEAKFRREWEIEEAARVKELAEEEEALRLLEEAEENGAKKEGDEENGAKKEGDEEGKNPEASDVKGEMVQKKCSVIDNSRFRPNLLNKS
jgi:hypothetical protein